MTYHTHLKPGAAGVKSILSAAHFVRRGWRDGWNELCDLLKRLAGGVSEGQQFAVFLSDLRVPAEQFNERLPFLAQKNQWLSSVAYSQVPREKQLGQGTDTPRQYHMST